MGANNTRHQLEQRIIAELANKSHTLTSLSKTLGSNYYTVRAAVRDLQHQELILSAGYTHRNVKYSLNPAKRDSAYVPLILNRGQRIPVNYLIGWFGKEKNIAAVEASRSLPALIVRLFYLGYQNLELSEPISAPLNRLKSEMAQNAAVLKALLSVYDQILSSDDLWDPEKLATMTGNRLFNTQELLTAYEKYANKKDR